MNLASGGTAEPIAFAKSNVFNAATDKFDVTAFGDPNKTYVAGLPDASGNFGFWYDDATTQTYAAAVDGVARKFYWYPDFTNSPTVYWYGTWFVDFSITSQVDAAIEGTASWNAAGPINKSTA
jgi:hypothetical protein